MAELYELLNRKRRESLFRYCTPGHKGDFPTHIIEMDFTEMSDTDSLHAPIAIIKNAQKRAAHIFGASDTFFLVNGSTVGLLASISACCTDISKQSQVLVERTCHSSVIHALCISGAVPSYIYPEFLSEWGFYSTITPQQIRNSMNTQIACVVIQSPNYFGICADVAAIADIVHSFGATLIVDQAHGAHFGFSTRLPPSAISQGADFVVQSAHKTLPSLTQTALLHVKSCAHAHIVRPWLNMLQTTSPSYIFLASLDRCTDLMEKYRDNGAYDRLLDWIELYFGGLELLKADIFDPTRVVVASRNGNELGYNLEKMGIIPEMCGLGFAVFILTIADNQKTVKLLADVLRNQNNTIPTSHHQPPPKAVYKMNPRQAFCSPSINLPIEKALGNVASRLIYVCPPGVPLLAPGELITAEIVTALEKIGIESVMVVDE